MRCVMVGDLMLVVECAWLGVRLAAPTMCGCTRCHIGCKSIACCVLAVCRRCAACAPVPVAPVLAVRSHVMAAVVVPGMRIWAFAPLLLRPWWAMLLVGGPAHPPPGARAGAHARKLLGFLAELGVATHVSSETADRSCWCVAVLACMPWCHFCCDTGGDVATNLVG